MINKALELLKSGTAHAFRPQGDAVLVVTKNAIVKRHFTKYGAKQSILAVNINGQVIGNSSRVFTESGNVSQEQLALGQLVPMIPFDVMKQAKLNLATYRQLDFGDEETIHRAHKEYRITEAQLKNIRSKASHVVITNEYQGRDYSGDLTVKKQFDVEYRLPEHFTGARLFSVDGRVFLLDLDRNELQHGIINPFLVELQDKSVTTIAKAYQSLKPQAVVAAESDGLEVLRQGEWFLVPVTNDLVKKRIERDLAARIKQAKIDGDDIRWPERSGRWATAGFLRAGPNRPNTVTVHAELDGIHYVSGTMSHSGREHKDLELTGFYMAVPNTSITSWTITGDID